MIRTRAAFIGFTPIRHFLSGTRNTKKKHPKKEKDKQSQLRSILPDYQSAGGELARQRWEQRALGLAHKALVDARGAAAARQFATASSASSGGTTTSPRTSRKGRGRARRTRPSSRTRNRRRPRTWLCIGHDYHALCIAPTACSARRISLTTNLSSPLAVLHFQIHRKR